MRILALTGATGKKCMCNPMTFGEGIVEEVKEYQRIMHRGANY